MLQFFIWRPYVEKSNGKGNQCTLVDEMAIVDYLEGGGGKGIKKKKIIMQQPTPPPLPEAWPVHRH